MSNLNFTGDLRKIYFHQFSTAPFNIALNTNGLTALFSNNNQTQSKLRVGEGFNISSTSIQYLNPNNNTPRATCKLTYHGTYSTQQTGTTRFPFEMLIRINGTPVQTMDNTIVLQDHCNITGSFILESINHNDLIDFIINIQTGGFAITMMWDNFSVLIEEL